MWKYIVTWIIVRATSIACPQPPTNVDEFGREARIEIQTMELCYEIDTTHMDKEFNSRKEAAEFINRGQDKKAAGVFALYNQGELHNFKLDSFRVKKKK